MWHGYLCPEETGMHRISLQSHFPGIEAFERNHVENGDLSVATSGNLYIRECKDAEALTRYGRPYFRKWCGESVFRSCNLQRWME